MWIIFGVSLVPHPARSTSTAAPVVDTYVTRASADVSSTADATCANTAGTGLNPAPCGYAYSIRSPTWPNDHATIRRPPRSWSPGSTPERARQAQTSQEPRHTEM